VECGGNAVLFVFFVMIEIHGMTLRYTRVLDTCDYFLLRCNMLFLSLIGHAAVTCMTKAA